MSGFNLAEMLQKAGVNIDTDDKMQVEHIGIDLIVPDENNFYELSGLDELAASIALCGLQQPLLVRPMPGDESQVIITSGHRRHAALKMLIEQDGREDLRDVPCIVGPSDENPKLTQLKLIMANSTARKISSADLAKQAEQIEQLLYELKEDGMEFPGRMRDHVAQACNVSTGKLARVRFIRGSLIQPLLDKWEHGQLSDDRAYNLAHASVDIQKAAAQEMADKAKPAEAPAPTQNTRTVIPVSPYKFDVDTANAREHARMETQIRFARRYVDSFCSERIAQAAKTAVIRADIIKGVKEAARHYENLFNTQLCYSFERSSVILSDRKDRAEYTHTEFADAMLIAAFQSLLEKPKATPAGWQTGTPTARGAYVVGYRRQPGGPMFYRNAFWTAKKWEQLDSLIEVLCWMPAPDVDA